MKLFTLSALAICSLVSAQTPYPIITAFGPLVGVLLERTVEYRGIPFADAPVGARRFHNSELIQPWAETLDAREHRPGCLQRFGTSPQDPREVSEDCLYLNIFAPLPPTNTPLPVMVWFHGGNYQSGAGSSPLYDGTFLANQTNVIVVGVNYRLNFLGWGYLEAAGIVGNMGLHDKILALEFIQRTISSFGGDPNKVTVFGQSAGGTSIGALVSSPQVKGLFSQAILQSNPFGLGIHSQESATRVANRFVGYAGCDVDAEDLVECLMNLSGEQILQAVSDVDNFIDISDFLQNFYPWTPVVDHEYVMEQPITAYRNGRLFDIPMMTGHVSEEGVLYAYGFLTEAITEEDYIILTQVLFPGLPFLELYPPSLCPLVDGAVDCRPLIAGAVTDYVWICPTRYAAQGALRNYTSPYYQYRFDHAFSFEHGWGPGQSYCRGFVCHGGELPFSFNDCFVPDRFPDFLCTPEESVVGNEMSSAWGMFAHQSNPNGAGNIPNWLEFSLAVDNYMMFSTPKTFPISNLRTEFCDVFDGTGYHPEMQKSNTEERIIPKADLMKEVRLEAKRRGLL